MGNKFNAVIVLKCELLEPSGTGWGGLKKNKRHADDQCATTRSEELNLKSLAFDRDEKSVMQMRHCSCDKTAIHVRPQSTTN